jgi:hypothetical protein
MTIEPSSPPTMILFPKRGCKQLSMLHEKNSNLASDQQQVDRDGSTFMRTYNFILGDYTKNHGLHTEKEENKPTLQPTWRRTHNF